MKKPWFFSKTLGLAGVLAGSGIATALSETAREWLANNTDQQPAMLILLGGLVAFLRMLTNSKIDNDPPS